MSRTLADLLAVVLSTLGFAAFFVPPGYLLGFASNVQGFRNLPLTARLLWAVTLSAPVSILTTVFLSRHHMPGAVLFAVLFCALSSLAIVCWQVKTGRFTRRTEWAAPERWTLIAMAVVALYCMLATLGITVGNRLYEGVFAADWGVRVPLTAAAIYHNIPIPTPFYGLEGQTFPLRYYYYWYVLCGAVGRLVHQPARAVLAASTVWSAWVHFATLFLLWRYLFRDTSSTRSVGQRWLYLLALPVSCILGLDVLPLVAGLLVRPIKLAPEMEWWRSQGDFSMSFHTAVLYAPHHTVGVACCMMGFLLLTLCSRRAAFSCVGWNTIIRNAFLAGVCFAAAVGTSTYITVVFVLVCMLLVLERTLARDWRAVSAVALTGVFAIAMSTAFIHETLTNAGSSAVTTGHSRFIGLALRNYGITDFEIEQTVRALHTHARIVHVQRRLLRCAMTAILYIVELGFFGFVLWWRALHDWRERTRLTAERRMQWVLFTGLAVAALFLSSSPVIGINDLGRHAGFALRIVAVLWALPLVAQALRQKPFWPLFSHRAVMVCVYACVALGLSAQLWQSFIQRSYLYLVDRHVIRVPFPPFPEFQDFGHRYFDTRQAFEALDKVTTPDDRIQFNPGSTYWTLMSDYLNRPVAAFDLSCGTGLGGDAATCAKDLPAIRALFGGGKFFTFPRVPFRPDGVTQEAFLALCQEHRLTAVVATASDRVWPEHTSWVWSGEPLFSNASVRVMPCPKP